MGQIGQTQNARRMPPQQNRAVIQPLSTPPTPGIRGAQLIPQLQSKILKFVIRIFSSERQRPSGVSAWQMPLPPDDPMPPLGRSRFFPPHDAQEASCFAASDRIASLFCMYS